MTYRRTPHGQAYHVWSIDEQDTRILRIGWGVVMAGVAVGACGVALMETAFAAFGILIFLGLMIPCAAGVFVADHLANEPEEIGDGVGRRGSIELAAGAVLVRLKGDTTCNATPAAGTCAAARARCGAR